MRTITSGFALGGTVAAAIALLAGCAGTAYEATGQQVRLWGSSEVAPVRTQAYGTGVINIAADRGVTVTLSVIDMVPTAAHIHEGAVGANGPVIVPLNKISEGAFVAPDNAKLTEAQYAAYKAGNLYVNVHSVKYPDGEVRAQIAGR
ncbi:MAG: CHRD domain-containing protein [Casimicrobiaceae bacterium]